MTNKFLSDIKKVWEDMLPRQKEKILNNVWCKHCAKVTTIVHYTSKVKGGDLIPEGEWKRCGGRVARLIENE